MSLWVHIDNKEKDVFILKMVSMKLMLTSEKEYSINFTMQKRANSYVFVNGVEIYKLIANYC